MKMADKFGGNFLIIHFDVIVTLKICSGYYA